MVFYSLYNRLLKKRNFAFSLQSILNDEEEHLNFVLKKIQKMDPLWDKNLEDIIQFEHQKYFSFLIHLEKEVFDQDLMTQFHPAQQQSIPSYHKI